jgi:rod shape-determining protein MreD
LSALVVVATVLQGSLLTPLSLTYRPNLPLLIVICGAWMTGAGGGAWLGFWAGLFMAALSSMFVGSFTFSYLVVGWCVGRAREEVYGDWPTLLIPVAGLGTFAAEFIFFLWNPRHVWAPFSLLGQAGANAVLAFLVYFPLAAIVRRLKR